MHHPKQREHPPQPKGWGTKWTPAPESMLTHTPASGYIPQRNKKQEEDLLLALIGPRLFLQQTNSAAHQAGSSILPPT